VSEQKNTQPTSIRDLQPKMRLEGRVTKVELFGALVDIGLEREGLLHISQLPERVNRVTDILHEGDQITVWVKEVNKKRGLVTLTMIEPPRLEWRDLQPKQKYVGKVTRIESFGAFVDIGAPREGLVHISRLSPQRVESVSDVVQVGDEVTVWVHEVNKKAGRISLTMVEPPAVDWDDLRIGDIYRGKVTRLESFGAFVDIGAPREGLLHVRDMGVGYLDHPSEFLEVGEEVEVQVLKVDRRRGRIELGMKGAGLELTEEEMEEPPTVMELALRQALAEKARQRQRQREEEDETRARARREQEEILARTLEQLSR